MSEIVVFSWNPRRRFPLPVVRRFEIGPRTNNFGDLVGPKIVSLMLRRLGLENTGTPSSNGRKLFSVGSVLHFAEDGDVVWGSGMNGKISADRNSWKHLDVRAIRGPATQAFITSRSGISVPDVYGDPALLLFELGFPMPARSTERGTLFIPNLNDSAHAGGDLVKVSPRKKLEDVITAIASSEAVVTSSLHAFLFAELLDVPVALLKPRAESDFKYLDYARGTGRAEIPMFDDLESAKRHARSSSRHNDRPLSQWSSEKLLRAFPADLFQSAEADR